MLRRLRSFCFTCWGRGWILIGHEVPAEELRDWQIAELMVNGGEYVTMTKETCQRCGGLGVKAR